MTIFTVRGMTCGGCSGSVTRALENVGLRTRVDLAAKTAGMQSGPELARGIQVLQDACFEATQS